MKSTQNHPLIWLLIICPFISNAQKKHDYPIAPKETSYNVYFEDTIAAPYQWMENANDPRLNDWLAEQSKLTNKEERQQTHVWVLRSQIASMYRDTNTEFTEDYIKEGRKNKPSKYQFKFEFKRYNDSRDFYWKTRNKSGYSTLIKTKKLRNSKDDIASVRDYYVNEDYDLLAAKISHKGSDWEEVYFYNLQTGEQYPDTLKHVRNSSHLIWQDNYLIYDRFAAPSNGRELIDKPKGQAIYKHIVGTNQSADKLLFENTDRDGKYFLSIYKTDSSNLIINHVIKSNGKLYRANSLMAMNEETNELVFNHNFLVYPNDSSIYFSVQHIENDTAIVKTNYGAPNGKVLLANITQQNKLSALIPEYDITLRSVNKFGKDYLACIYRTDGNFIALIHNKKGELVQKIDFPEGKKVTGFYENSDDAKYTVFGLSSFYHPTISYQISLEDFSFKPVVEIQVPYEVGNLETRYVTYKSKDGTEVPMYITCLKSTKLNGKNPTLLYGYGGYGITVEPNYDNMYALWLLHGGILAIPNIRGGGAGGDDWGKAGRRLKKQNAIDDFIGAAEYLINNKYTSSDKLAAKGGSHGGLLVAAAAIQKPELFKAVIAEAGPLDMLRKDDQAIFGTSINVNEFGLTANEEDYKVLKSYSPLYNIKANVKYPNFLLITGDSDTRVPPHHSYKFLARMQAVADPTSSYQLYVIPGAGHGGALTPEDAVNKLLFTNYYIFDQLGLKFW